MSEKQNALEAMLAQYESNNKPKYEKRTEKVYDLKNYFNTFIKEGEKSVIKTIRILPSSDGSTPFIEMYGHKAQVDGEWKTFPCLKKEKNEACPFCEAREELLATGKDDMKELAKKYSARLMYIVKVIDRNNEADGVKFWRFNHDWRKEGVYDKIHGVINAIKKDVTDAQTGRDLVLTINRNQNNKPVVSAVASLDPTPLSNDKNQAATWMADTRKWEDVYSIRPYKYMEIIVKGGVPVWDKESKQFVDKASLKHDGGDGLEAELTLSVENVKAGVKTATEASKPTSEGEVDDLPF